VQDELAGRHPRRTITPDGPFGRNKGAGSRVVVAQPNASLARTLIGQHRLRPRPVRHGAGKKRQHLTPRIVDPQQPRGSLEPDRFQVQQQRVHSPRPPTGWTTHRVADSHDGRERAAPKSPLLPTRQPSPFHVCHYGRPHRLPLALVTMVGEKGIHRSLEDQRRHQAAAWTSQAQVRGACRAVRSPATARANYRIGTANRIARITSVQQPPSTPRHTARRGVVGCLCHGGEHDHRPRDARVDGA
jgi:hypothetical protein